MLMAWFSSSAIVLRTKAVFILSSLEQSFSMASNFSPRRELGIKQAYKLIDVLCSLTYLIASRSIYALFPMSTTRGISKDFRRRELGKRKSEYRLNMIVGRTFHVPFIHVSTDSPSSSISWGRDVRGSDTVWKSLSICRRYRHSKNLNPFRFWFKCHIRLSQGYHRGF